MSLLRSAAILQVARISLHISPSTRICCQSNGHLFKALSRQPPLGQRAFSASAFAEFVSSTAMVRGCEKVLQFIHETTGTAWWASILITVITARSVITLPLAVLQRRIVQKLRDLKPHFDEIARKVAAEIAVQQKTLKWTEMEAKRRFQSEVRRLKPEFFVKHNVHPAKTILLPFIQIPLWISISFAMRNLTAGRAQNKPVESREELQHSGVFWFKDLTQPDGMWALPVLNGLVSLGLAELYFAAGTANNTKMMRVFKAFTRVTSLLIIPVTALMPAGVAYYWLLSSLFGVAQFFLFFNPTAQRLFGLPAVRSQTNLVKNTVARFFAQRR